jgi:hypothetical protein
MITTRAIAVFCAALLVLQEPLIFAPSAVLLESVCRFSGNSRIAR